MQSLRAHISCDKIRVRLLCRKRHALLVLAAPEPSDVIWENLEFSGMQRLQRRFIILLLNLFIIFIGRH